MSAGPRDLIFRVGGADDGRVRQGILDLLQDMFELDLGPACELWSWHEGYRAYSWMDGGTIAANVSSRPLPLMVGDRAVDALQIHCAATRPPYRNRGLFTDLMGRVLDDADRRFECVLLYTATPDLYRRFGFRPLVAHRFRGRLDDTAAAGAERRDLSLRNPDDLDLMRRAFAQRRPQSRHLGLAGNGDVFAVNALAHPDWQLTWLADAQALIVWARPGGVTRLHDVVAGAMPAPALLAAALELDEVSTPEIEVMFPPDRIAGSFVPVPHVPEDEDILCVRGPFAIEGTPFMLPETALS